MIFSLWAPRAKDVHLILDQKEYPMVESSNGWWHTEGKESSAAADYYFSINGCPLPDPRSQWQPAGVFGPSRKVDHCAYIWTDSNWQPPPMESAIFYEFHTGTFSHEGTFHGARKRLGYLKNLGITHVNLMPVNAFSGNRGWGYDGVCLFAPHHAYGGPLGLKNFVNACHEEGLAVVLDVVFNHLGPEGNFLERFGPYFSEIFRLPWGKTMNFDGPDSDEVRRFIIDCASMWVRDYHFDGLRIDAVQSMFDTSAIHILEELTSEIKLLEKELKRDIILIAESDTNDPWIIRPINESGCGFDAQWTDDFHHAVHALLTQEQNGYYADFGSLSDLAKSLTRIFVMDGKYSKFRRRNYGRPAETSAGGKFIIYLENHDYAGHRADGQRFSALVDRDKLKIAATLLLTAPFVPMLFQGEEWGATSRFHYFTNFQDSELAEKVQEGRKNELAEFGWNSDNVPDPQEISTFEQCRVDWTEPDIAGHADILEWYQALIALRRNNPALQAGSVKEISFEYHENEKWFMYDRGDFLVVANMSENAQDAILPHPENWSLVLSSNPEITILENEIQLSPFGVSILQRSQTNTNGERS